MNMTGEDPMFELQSNPSLAEWDDFQRGFFYVQDASTLLAVHALDPQPGENILDLCAAPGGKTACMAQRMENRGQILAQDQAPRLPRLRENCARLGVTCVTISDDVASALCADHPGVEAAPGSSAAAPFDRILLDAPCSNSGVFRRRIDARWRIRPEQLAQLRRVQGALLRQAATRLKPAGRLVYSTCSLEPEENESVTREFLEEHAEFTLESQRQLFPFEDQVDGAYVAALRRHA